MKDNKQIILFACGHIFMLIANRDLTPKECLNWLMDVDNDHNKIHKGMEK